MKISGQRDGTLAASGWLVVGYMFGWIAPQEKSRHRYAAHEKQAKVKLTDFRPIHARWAT